MKFTIILSIMLVGCKSTTEEKTLSDIETLMDCCPDSALNKLNKIAPEQLTSDETNAYYALLYSQALDKNYIDTTNDSLILIAENYYTKHNDNKKSMLAHYYHGRVKYNAKEYPQSLYFITKAFHNAESLKDYYWMGCCTEEISIIYNENFHGSDALHYAQVAFDNLQKSGKQPYINYSLLNLARINNNNNNDSIANQMAKQVLDSAIVYNDSLLLAHANILIATSYIGLSKYNNAIEIFDTLKDTDYFNSRLKCLLGISYLGLGELTKATDIFDNIEDDYTTDYLSLIYEISKKQGNIPTALSTLSELYDNLERTFINSMNQNFGQKLSEFHNQEQKINELGIKQAKRSQTITIITCAFCFIIIICITILWYRKYNYKLEKNYIIAQNLKEIIQIKDTNNHILINNLLTTRFEIIDDLCQIVYENKATGLDKKKISIKIEKLINQLSSDKKKINELEQFADKHYANLISSFKADFPDLKNADCLLFLYTILGFSISAIALFLGEDKIEAVYNRKARIKNKIRKLDQEKRDQYAIFLR